MKQIFVNLKRFDVPISYGGICPMDDPIQWIQWVMDESVASHLGELDGIEVTYLLPEALIPAAVGQLKLYTQAQTQGLHIGCQGVFREDVKPGGNFGAFSTNLPAAAAANMGCTFAMIGHSEERKDKQDLIAYCSNDPTTVKQAVNRVLNQEVHRALEQDIHVLLCVGETAAEKGEGTEEQQRQRVKEVLTEQLVTGLNGIQPYIRKMQFVVGYEPVWAIGPGKTPPDKEYISFVSACIQDIVKEYFDFEIPVVYGGGLKEANAAVIASIDTIGGGLVALTTFTIPPAFEPTALKNIIDAYK